MISNVTFEVIEENPQKTLSAFVKNTGDLLKSITLDNKCDYLTYKYIKNDLHLAWEEISEIVPTYSRTVLEADTDTLNDHGLTRRNLDLKFRVLQNALSEFKSAHNDRTENHQGSSIGLARSWLDKLLGIINKIFMSLLAAVPGGGAIEEYKGMIEEVIPDSDEPEDA